MTTSSKFLLAYHSVNAQEASDLSAVLQKAEFEIEHINSDDLHQDESIYDRIKSHFLPCILLIGDNFLKDANCMHQAINLLHDNSAVDRLHIIITDGQETNPSTGHTTYHPTSFDRVSNVIQYMNYWQDQYLDMRKQKRSISPDQEENFNQQLNVTRSISSEVGEFLRLLRGFEFKYYKDIKANHYEQFFQMLNIANSHADYKALATNGMMAAAGAVAGVGNFVNGDSYVTTNNEITNTPEEVITEVEQIIENAAETNVEEVSNLPDIALPTEENIQNAVSETVQASAESRLHYLEDLAEAPAEMEEEIETTVDATIEVVEDNLLAAPETDSFEILPSSMNDDVEVDLEENLEETSLNITDAIEEAIPSNIETNIVEETTNLVEDTASEVSNNFNETVKTVSEEIANVEEEMISEIEETVMEEVEDSLPETIEVDTAIDEIETENPRTIIDELLSENELIDEEVIEESIEEEATEVIDSIGNAPVTPSTINGITSSNEPIIDPVISTVMGMESEHQETVEDVQNVVEQVEEMSPDEAPLELEANEFTTSDHEDSTEQDSVLQSEIHQQLLAAKELLDEGNTDAGLIVYENLLEKHPDNNEIRLLYAASLAKRAKKYEKATEQLEQILQRNDQDVDAYHLLADIAEIHKDYILAKNYYEKVVSLDPTYPNVNYKLGMITRFHFPDQTKISADHFKKAIKLKKHHVDAHYQYAILMNENFGKYSKAIKHFKRTLKLNPLHPFAAYDLALLHHKMREFDRSAKYYKRACKNNPELKTLQNDAFFASLVQQEVDSSIGVAATDSIDQYVEEQAQLEIVTPVRPTVDKVVLITGATSGIGNALAHIFAENGYKLILTGRRTDRLQNMQDEFMIAYDNEIQILPFDVRDNITTNKVINELDEDWQNIDILINNAGLAMGLSPIQEGNIAHWETMIDTNIKGLLYMTRAIAPIMVKNQKGHIINVCSTAGKEVYPNGNVYCATKHAVDALTKAMRLDLYKHNIRVGQVCPAMVEETEFSLVRFEGDQDRAKIYEDFNPLTAHDVAQVIYFMVTQPNHVNIQDIVLQGTQQANSTNVHRSGRIYDSTEEE